MCVKNQIFLFVHVFGEGLQQTAWWWAGHCFNRQIFHFNTVSDISWMSWVWFLNVIYSALYGDDGSNNNKVSIPLQLHFKYMYTRDHQHHHIHVVHHFIQKLKGLTKVSPAEHFFFFSFQPTLSLHFITLHYYWCSRWEPHTESSSCIVGSVHSVTLSPVPSVRGFPLLSEVFHLPLVFYLWGWFFFSLFPPYLCFTALGFSQTALHRGANKQESYANKSADEL